jgi:hypothetical protein
MLLGMLQIDQSTFQQIQPELLPDESIVWGGRPVTSVVFHKEDTFLIPFSLLWGGFAIFWEASVLGLWSHNGSWVLGTIWGIPFVLFGQYLIWGRFLYTAWLKRRTAYAVTNRRVLAVQEGWTKRVASAYLDSLPALVKESGSNGIGVLRFKQPQLMRNGRFGWRSWNSLEVGVLPAFVDVQDVDSLYRLVSDLREKARASKS